MVVSAIRFSSLCKAMQFLVLSVIVAVQARDSDRFNYDDTLTRDSGARDFGPEDWDRLDCEGGDNVDDCLGYPDKWHMGQGWEIEENSCIWCPEDESNRDSECNSHHQSPINLERNRAIEGHEMENECIDEHWMKYQDSTCTWNHLLKNDAFTVERHALRISQPLNPNADSNSELYSYLGCDLKGTGKRWGRIDYSKGYGDWWFLSHIDFHVPSEHTQEGKRYSAEAQMYHFYSTSNRESGTDNEMGTVTVFMEAFDDAPPYEELDRVICQWRFWEDRQREGCGLDPIEDDYPGCFPPRPKSDVTNVRRRVAEEDDTETSSDNNMVKSPPPKFKTAYDVIMHNAKLQAQGHDLETTPHPVIQMIDEDFAPSKDDIDWESLFENESKRQRQREKDYKKFVNNNTTHIFHEQHERKLINYDHLEFNNYFLMLGVRTEYYFRYEGTQTIPPCYGPYTSGSRTNTNHWRVLKDPIRVHPRQITEMQRLLKDRIAPSYEDDEFRCKPDTAAKVNSKGEVSVARPLQSWRRQHSLVFCECKNWPSKWPEDREWCDIDSVRDRFYDRPYNYDVAQSQAFQKR